MERARIEEEKGGVKLPIGFRFLPTDEELLIHYLKRKILSLPLPSTVIPELEEAFHFSPWDLPGELKEKRYFFCKRKRNILMNKCNSNFSSTDCGYWKSSGKDKQIMGAPNYVIGIKRSFSFYQGRNLKTQWVMQEFSLVGYLKTPFLAQRLAMQVGDWVVCRLFQRKRRARDHASTLAKNKKKSWAELGVETTSFSSCSSGVTEISSGDLDQEASS